MAQEEVEAPDISSTYMVHSVYFQRGGDALFIPKWYGERENGVLHAAPAGAVGREYGLISSTSHSLLPVHGSLSHCPRRAA